MKHYPKPKFYPRAQFNGTFRYGCIYCGWVNLKTLRPGVVKTRCSRCLKYIWWGHVAHIPAAPNTSVMKDSVIPIYALDECTIDPLRFDPMPPAIFGGKIRQHGRLHMTVIHDNFYVTDDALPQSDGECEDYIPTSKGNPEPE